MSFVTKLLANLREVWFKGIEPSSEVEETVVRQKIRLFLGLLVPACLSVLCGATRVLLLGTNWPVFWLLSATGIVLLVTYAIGRTKYYYIGMLLTLISLSLPSFIFTIISQDTIDVQVTNRLIWLLMPLLLGGLWLSKTRLLILVIVEMTGVLLLGLFIPFSLLPPSLGYISTMSILIFIATVIREQNQTQIATQTQRAIENEARFRSLFEATFEGLVVHQKETVWDANPAFERLFGYNLSEIKWQSVLDFIEPTMRKATQDYLQTNPEVPIETIGIKRDGSPLHLEILSKSHIYQNRVLQITTLRDITQHKKNRLALQQAKEEAETANKAKSEFLAHMSHELRTPLNGILGYTQILGKDKTLTPKQKQAITVMHQSGEHLLTLLNDILDLSKIEAGKIVLEVSPFSLEVFLEAIVTFFRNKVEEEQLSFKYLPPTNLPQVVIGDERRLRQILINLLSNAFKFTPAGQITFQVTLLELTHLSNRLSTEEDKPPATVSQTIRFEVMDTGIGIVPENIPVIFTPFYQISSQQPTKVEGTGLGLPISKNLLEMMGSTLQVESEPGQGSIFFFDLTLPIIEKELKENKPASKTIIGFKGTSPKILVVDDIAHNRLVLVDLLRSLNFEVFEADTGEEALLQTKIQKPDLILMDLVMPVVNGFEATKQIRQWESEQKKAGSLASEYKLTIIAISASAFEEDKQKSLKVGCNSFLGKPFKTEPLLDILQTHLDLTWLYETPSDTDYHQQTLEISTPLILPPQTEMETLFKAVFIGQFKVVKNELERLQLLDEKYQPFVNQLNQLTRQYKLNQIKKVLETHYQTVDWIPEK